MSKCKIIFMCLCLIMLSACRHTTHNYFQVIGESPITPPVDVSTAKGASWSDDTYHTSSLQNNWRSEERDRWVTRVFHNDTQRDGWHTGVNYHEAVDQKDKYAGERTANWPMRYHLDTGDRVRIIVYSQRTLSRLYSVDDSGHISVPLVGMVYARGATTAELERRISAFLKVKYLKDPKVTVEVATYRPFFILGQVRNSGRFPYVIGMTAETAAAIAGGFTPRANERAIRITRVYNGKRYTLLVSPHFPILPGDTVYVRERFF